MHHAAKTSIPTLQVKPMKPWIQHRTLELIQLRNSARLHQQYNLEKQLNKQIRSSAKQDRAQWIEQLLESGDWKCIKQHQAGPKRTPGRLQNSAGQMVSSDERADTMATYFADVVWHVPFAQLTDNSPSNPTLPINTDDFSMEELNVVLRRLRQNRCPGHDQIHAEFWQALAKDGEAFETLLNLCNSCLALKCVPTSWKHSTVATLFKKGDDSLPANYRPISLLAVGYKVLASLLLSRFKNGGCEKSLRQSQFGFRKQRSTTDAIFIVQRLIDNTLASKSGRLSMVFLDWSKAFDKVSHPALLQSLRRFGIPESMVELIANIYSDRTFAVKDGPRISDMKPQSSGIAQGCPLSPYLFIIMMTIIMADVERKVPTAFAQCGDLTYADDTAIHSDSVESLQVVFDELLATAKQYGLEPNLDKTVHLQVRHSDDIVDASGSPLKAVSKVKYLGSVVTADGQCTAAVIARLGESRASFSKLEAIWKHSALSKSRKLEVYKACVISKLLFGLEIHHLKKHDRNRLDAFHAKCLRKILRIPHPMISHVSNRAVLTAAGEQPLSTQLTMKQVILFCKIAVLPDESPLRETIFQTSSFDLKMFEGKRRKGRPRVSWVSAVSAHALLVAGGNSQRMQDIFRNEAALHLWKQAVKLHFLQVT